MKFALVNGNKVEAIKGAKGLCPSCGAELIAKCGEVNIHHWAHKGYRDCDPWWENETEWHRSWKESFPVDWQEVIHKDEVSGEKHIADVKTQSGWALEFQHSFLNPEERRSRNAFYPKLVWIVDGTRRKIDIRQFETVINRSTLEINNPPLKIGRVTFPEECRLFKEWHDSKALVFFDFQETQEPTESQLWFIFPKLNANVAYIWPISRQWFIEMLNQNQFDKIVEGTILPIQNELKDMEARRKNTGFGYPNNMPRFAHRPRRSKRF